MLVAAVLLSVHLQGTSDTIVDCNGAFMVGQLHWGRTMVSSRSLTTSTGRPVTGVTFPSRSVKQPLSRTT